jgi:hypothetical protein
LWRGQFGGPASSPKLREQIHENATVVILRDENPELAGYNVSLEGRK